MDLLGRTDPPIPTALREIGALLRGADPDARILYVLKTREKVRDGSLRELASDFDVAAHQVLSAPGLSRRFGLLALRERAPAGKASEHADRVKWNAKYSAVAEPTFAPHTICAAGLALGLPEGRVLELACGPSGNALALAQAGRHVTAVDISDVGLRILGKEAQRRGLGDRIALVDADLGSFRPEPRAFALVLCTHYWDRGVFDVACGAVAAGGVLAWVTFSLDERKYRPTFRPEWCVGEGEPASLLPEGFTVIEQASLDDGRSATRRLLARRRS
jgi:SAM-dependent methyltransferase